jgi:hypothetical protein
MDDDDIRHALHTTYTTAGTKPTFVPEAFKEHAARPRRGPMVTSLVAVVAAVVVAVPIGVGVLLRSGVHGTTSVSNLSVLDLHMYGAKDGWAWSGGDNVLHTTSGVGHWTIVPPPIGTELITGLAFAGPDSARVLAVPAGQPTLAVRHVDAVGNRRWRRDMDARPAIPSSARGKRGPAPSHRSRLPRSRFRRPDARMVLRQSGPLNWSPNLHLSHR